jgi:hypothetical protein
MKVTLVLLSILFSSYSQAGIYKCTDSDGKKSYQKSPCENISNAAEFNVTTGGSIAVPDIRKQEIVLEKQKEQEQAKIEEIKKQEQDVKQQRIDTTLEENKKNLEIIKANPKKFSAFAIPPYTLEDHPPLFDDFIERLPEIQRYRRWAAKKALFSGQCDRVEASSVNFKSTQKNLVFLVECSNTERFYYNETDLSAE